MTTVLIRIDGRVLIPHDVVLEVAETLVALGFKKIQKIDDIAFVAHVLKGNGFVVNRNSDGLEIIDWTEQTDSVPEDLLRSLEGRLAGDATMFFSEDRMVYAEVFKGGRYYPCVTVDMKLQLPEPEPEPSLSERFEAWREERREAFKAYSPLPPPTLIPLHPSAQADLDRKIASLAERVAALEEKINPVHVVSLFGPAEDIAPKSHDDHHHHAVDFVTVEPNPSYGPGSKLDCHRFDVVLHRGDDEDLPVRVLIRNITKVEAEAMAGAIRVTLRTWDGWT